VRNTLDTFLMLLSTELSGLSFHALRFDTNVPDDAVLQINTVNVSFYSSGFSNLISTLSISLDVVYENELTGLETSQQLFELLNKRYMTEKYDYTNPSTPVPTGGMIYWDRDAIRFIKVPSEYYFHYNCTFDLKHHIVL